MAAGICHRNVECLQHLNIFKGSSSWHGIILKVEGCGVGGPVVGECRERDRGADVGEGRDLGPVHFSPIIA